MDGFTFGKKKIQIVIEMMIYFPNAKLQQQNTSSKN